MKKIHLGLFVTAFSSLTYEILLTRIFSVTMWYHYAFMAISIAMFGLTFGATLIYVFPKFFTREKTQYHTALFSLLFGISIPVSFGLYLATTFLFISALALSTWVQLFLLLALALMYFTLAVPFILSGIVICLSLTRFSNQISTLYAADLSGAALGCLGVFFALNIISAPTAIVCVGGAAAFGGFLFAEPSKKILRKWALIGTIFIFLLAILNHTLEPKGNAIFAIRSVKGTIEKGILYEKWNSFSRVTVEGNAEKPTQPFGWGLSDTLPSNIYIPQLFLRIDSVAGTPLTQFSGNLNSLDFLKYDIVNLAHHLRENAKVLVIGVGGGRDILSALDFKQKEVTGVEVNGRITEAVTGKYGDFTGHLDRYPNVHIINDEARSYVDRSNEKYDIMQISLIDTWAATAAGAFVLTENSLYTVEAWQSFINHLSDDGILTVSRWYFRERPGEMYRLVSLASESLRGAGIENPRAHILIARKMLTGPQGEGPDGVGTILVSKTPFTPADIGAFQKIADQYKFEIVLTPDTTIDNTYTILAGPGTPQQFLDNYPINIAAPHDDNPFFFHMLRAKDFANPEQQELGLNSFNMNAVSILLSLLAVSIFFAFAFIVLPIVITMKKSREIRGMLPLIIYFASIGLGFMLIEISLLERLIIYLGSPVYSLSVILFSLLLSGGLGSYLTKSLTARDVSRKGMRVLLSLLAILAIGAALVPALLHDFHTGSLAMRIFSSVLVMGSIGIILGMAFPLGIKIASKTSDGDESFFWGVNGATSVVASVLGVVLSIVWSITITYSVGMLFYVLAVASFWVLTRREG